MQVDFELCVIGLLAFAIFKLTWWRQTSEMLSFPYALKLKYRFSFSLCID